MILVILGISVAILVVGLVMFFAGNWYRDEDLIPGSICLIGVIGIVISGIVAIGLGVGVSKLNVIDEKIAMYQEENTKIEEQISAAVESYQKYETDIFTEVKGEEAISLVALYPDLKADTLVQKQIEVYLANNEKIKELKESQINGSVKRWWLYFGG